MERIELVKAVYSLPTDGQAAAAVLKDFFRLHPDVPPQAFCVGVISDHEREEKEKARGTST